MTAREMARHIHRHTGRAPVRQPNGWWRIPCPLCAPGCWVWFRNGRYRVLLTTCFRAGPGTDPSAGPPDEAIQTARATDAPRTPAGAA